VNYIHF